MEEVTHDLTLFKNLFFKQINGKIWDGKGVGYSIFQSRDIRATKVPREKKGLYRKQQTVQADCTKGYL